METSLLNLIVTTRSGEETKIETEAGISIMEAIRDAGIVEIKAMCGAVALVRPVTFTLAGNMLAHLLR
jgi:hypothetical protein